jgi:hypothetical protein
MTRCTVSGEEPTNSDSASVPNSTTRPDGQHVDHWTMCPTEIIEAGFKRPVRLKYQHISCGTVTSMPKQIAETYASNPFYYGRTFCCGCGDYFPVGEDGEFVWDNTTDKVGT